MAKGGMHAPPHEIQPVIARAVHILLECILVYLFIYLFFVALTCGC